MLRNHNARTTAWRLAYRVRMALGWRPPTRWARAVMLCRCNGWRVRLGHLEPKDPRDVQGVPLVQGNLLIP